MFKFLIFLIFVMLSTISHAEDWAPILYRASDNRPIEADWHSVKTEKGLIFLEIRYSPISKLKGWFSDVAFNRESIVVSCDKNSYAVATEADELKNGSIRIKSVKPLPSLSYITPAKDSEPYSVIQKLCKAVAQTNLEKNEIKVESQSEKPIAQNTLKSNIKSSIIEGSPADYNWRFSGKAIDQNQNIYINTPSIKRLDQSWISVLTKSEYEIDKKTYAGNIYRFSINQVLINCTTDTAALPKTDFYSSNNNLQETYYQEIAELKEEKIPPNSLLEFVKKTACPIGMAQSLEGKYKSEENSNQNLNLSTGTGWAIAANYLVTADHVINNAENILVMLSENDFIDAKVVARDPSNDVAIIKVSKPLKGAILTISSKQPRLASKVAALGYPLTSLLGTKIQATTGEISGLTGIMDDQRFYQISAPIQPGSSGGPLLNSEGEVIGIVSSKLNDINTLKTTGGLAQNVNFALKFPYVKALIDSAGIETKTKSKKVLNIEDAINSLKNGVYLIYVSTNQLEEK